MSADRVATGTPLDDVNDNFHDAYDAQRHVTAGDVPVVVVMGNSITLVRGTERHAVDVSPRPFHLLKSAAHAPVALYAALLREPPGELSPAARSVVAGIRRSCERALASAEAELDVPPVRQLLRATIDAANRSAGAHDTAALAQFAVRTGPALLEATEAATHIQLETFDARVTELLRGLTDVERASFEVVVTGDHQARARSLGMQYFAKLCGEPPGSEGRVTYSESVDSVDDALELVGTRRLDRSIATAFFGDERRLQQDVLGNAVERQLAAHAAALTLVSARGP